MTTLVVVENPKRWPFDLRGVEVVSARSYLVERRWAELRRATVFNVCRSYAYQTTGYYVSLLAAARGHRPLPSVATLQGLHLSPLIRLTSQELEDLIERSLAPLRSDAFELSVYFGRNTARRYDRLSRALFNAFPAPFLRARFRRDDDRWRLLSARPVATSEIPPSHADFVLETARRYLDRPVRSGTARSELRYDLAILWNEDDENAPSDERAVKRFVKAAEEEGIRAVVVGREEYGRIAEFDALFIRETTGVDHHTYRFARRAAAEALQVIDDPESIVRCTNKVYQAELFGRHGIPCPETVVVHEGNRDDVVARVGLPCVLKMPDGSFSTGVSRVETDAQLAAGLDAIFETSELAIAQEWTPTAFDWRVGVLDREPLFAARYHMAPGHWQIQRPDGAPARRYGKVEAVPFSKVPGEVLETAVKAAGLIGDGLYGVDVKELEDGRVVVMEVNDNPNVEAGYEDSIAGETLYREVMRWFRRRLDARGAESTP